MHRFAVSMFAALALVRGPMQPGLALGGEKAPWDVDHPPGPGFEVHLDVTSGTWMNLDVSPDGGEIVFDLLGDLYLLPMGGGEARPLTSGMSWDMQPRFSPDGTKIAFTSDRKGGDNLWIIGRDGENATQVTSESFRLLNSPAWSPDGDWIVGRKHFTSRRSLGAGEIWLYHVTGGQGLQLVEKPNDQKDLGEPVFSPDGRFVYWSQDTTPGGVFEYNKDSNGQIYEVKKLDRETGRVETVLSGPGGAVRPTPSPDGRWLAFVRRVRFATTLFVHDLETGAEIPLTSALDRDLQETWAVHGVYPTLAWTPDSKSIVFYGEGKIRRIDVASKKVSDIPFRVRSTRELREAVRFPVEVSPEQFETKLLRWVTVSPGSDRVVFQALGKLWVKELPDGTPRRLTSQDDHFEMEPSFSRDGRLIVYTTWDDDELGRVRVVNAAAVPGRDESRVVVDEPGHYVEPVFAPGGDAIVYRKISGGGLLSPLHSQETGIYRVVPGNKPVRVRRTGSNPHFGSDPERLFYLEGGAKTRLSSCDLKGAEERTHFQSENATEMMISPDGKWAAFVERFNVYVLPFVATGGAIDVGPGTKSLPLKKVSSDAGRWIHFSGDSKKLHWSLGPELHTRELTEVFAAAEKEEKAEGDADENADENADEDDAGDDAVASEDEEAADDGVNLGFMVPSSAPEGVCAIVGARIITMVGDEVIEKGTIVVEGNRIVAVGKSGDVAVPSRAHAINGTGLTVMPGLVDVHQHGAHGRAGIIPQRSWLAHSWLSFGVTTIHDPSNDTDTIFAAAEMARAGTILSPRIFSTGTILYGASGSFKAEIESLDDARFHLRRMKQVGATSVKSYNQPRRDQRQMVLEAARELGINVVPEGGSLLQHNLTMIIDGHTGIEHSIPVASIQDDVRTLWSLTEVGYTPTLVVGYGGLWGEEYWYAKTDVWKNERLLAFVPRQNVDPRSRRRATAPDEEWNHVSNARICKELTDVGVRVNLGAHGQREGLGSHWEMWMFVQGGMTPLEAIRACTLNPAWYMGLDADVGSLEVGKLADLVVLEKNPLDDIRSSESIRFTMLNGRLYDARTMDELHPRKVKRPLFFFEKEGSPAPAPPERACGCGAH